MAAEDRILKILLQLQADVAGAKQTTGALKEVQAQATATAAAVNTVGQGNVVPINWKNVIDQQREFQELTKAGTAEELVRQGLIEKQMERRVVVETQIEAAEARIAGNTGVAARLEREAEIRGRALGIQRALNVTTEESIVLAEKLVLANEASVAPTALAGINLSKAKMEAMVLGRELAAGNVRASTLSSLLGSLGASVTIAGIAAYELYRAITASSDEVLRMEQESVKLTENLSKAVQEWIRLARTAQSFGDQVKLADKIDLELAKVAADMAKFRSEQLDYFAAWADKIVGFLSSASVGFTAPGVHPVQAELDKDRNAAQERYSQLVRDSNIELDAAKQSVADWAKAEADLPAGIELYTNKVNDLQSKLDGLDVQRHLNPADPKILAAYTEVARELQDAKDKLNQLGDEQDKLNKKSNEGKLIRQQILEFTREQALALQQVRNAQELINQNPFLSVDEKNALLIPLIKTEIDSLNTEIARGRSLLAGGTLDPAQYDRVALEVGNLQAKVASLGHEMQKLSFGGGLQAELVSWVNQFGTAAHQVAGIITGTLNTAIAGTSQAITGLIFGTRNWQQAFAQAAQSIVQNIIQIALQFVVSRLVMAAINRITGATEGAAASAQAAASAAAWAPAAVSASIASYGAASAAGLAAYLSAIAAGEAGAVAVGGIGGAAGGGGFQKGGYTGHGDPSELAGPVHKKEFVFTAEETAALGLPFLRSLAKAAGGQAKFEVGDFETGRGFPPGPEQYPGGRVPSGAPVYTGPTGYGPEPDILPGNLVPDRLGGIDITAGTGFTPRAGGPISGGIDISGGLGYTPGSGFAPPTLSTGPGGDVFGGVVGPGGTVYGIDPNTGALVYNANPVANVGGLTFGFFGTPGPRVGPNLGFGPGGLGGLTEDPHLSATQFAPFQTDFVAPGEGFDSDRTGAGRFRGARTMPALSSSRVPSRHLALGGLVDSIPAMLTPGEFVVRKPAVDHMGVEFLHALNSMQFPVRRLAAGGFIGDLAGTSSVSSAAQRDMHFNLFLDPNELRRHVLAHPDAEHRIEDLFSRKKLKFGLR